MIGHRRVSRLLDWQLTLHHRYIFSLLVHHHVFSRVCLTFVTDTDFEINNLIITVKPSYDNVDHFKFQRTSYILIIAYVKLIRFCGQTLTTNFLLCTLKSKTVQKIIKY